MLLNTVILTGRVFFSLVCILLTIDMVYNLTIAFRGWWSPKRSAQASPRHRFAVLVPAHNEGRVVGELLDTLANQDYPKELYHVYVSCDNCEDDTESVATDRGAITLVRNDQLHPGKTWNVKWALQQIPVDDFDAVAVFDADNLAESDFLSRMNDYLEAFPEAEAVQGYLDVKNPDDNWLTRAYAIAYWYTNRFWQLARWKWGLSSTLGGTGLVIKSSCIKRLGWDLQSLTEDLEFSAKVILDGGRVHWNEFARVYDEKPCSLDVSKKQRLRWMKGHFWVLWNFGPKAISSFCQTGKLQYLDLFLYMLAPAKAIAWLAGLTVVLLYSFFATLASGGSDAVNRALVGSVSFIWIPIVLILAHCAFVDVIGPSLHRKKIVLKYLKDVFGYFWFGVTWIPILIAAAFQFTSQGKWEKTEHTRNLSLDQVTTRSKI